MARQNERETVQNLQRYLRQLSYHEPSISPPPIDGILASDTQRALREFQALYGLPATGKADRKTWEMLYASYRASLTANSPPRTVAFFPYTPQPAEITLGKESFTVSVLQHMLRELSANYSEAESVTVTGIYDRQTADAVRSFQQKNRLPESGSVDVPTWNAIADQYNFLFAAEPYL